MIKKSPSGWLVDIQPAGRGGKRYRKTFKVKADALRWETAIKAKATDDPTFQLPRKDTRRLSELIQLWYDLHGINLKSSGDTYRRLMALTHALGDPLAYLLSAKHFAEYRAKRIAEGLNPSTLNRERSYLAGVFGELRRLGHWNGDNPLSRVRPIRTDQRDLTFLTLEQVEALMGALAHSKNTDVQMVSRLCLATGARWSEAANLKAERIRRSPGLITFGGTKSGKNRSVPIDEDLADKLATRLQQGPFIPCYGAFREAVERSGLDLPRGQLAHVLRHTFASHFIMRGGDILTLQRILGHHSITVTMRYAHLAAEYLDQARKLNPLAALTLR